MNRSNDLFRKSSDIIPGGVNSPVRAFRSVGSEPFFVKAARGSRIFDVDGNEYVDYVSSWGPMILGHAHPEVVEAICRAAERGTSYGAPTETEFEMAKAVTEAIPSIKMVRMVSSGTEAVMSAVRLARAFTGRNAVLKFAGCYHGHADSFLSGSAGSGLATFGIPASPGVPADLAQLTITVPYNDPDAVREAVRKHRDILACVVIEPVAGNMGVVLPQEGFLAQLRDITANNGILLVFDEVITGFRLHYGGYQDLAGIRPDLTCLGKIIGGGLPVGAFGGRRDIMEMLAPAGPVYQAGTLSGNPLAMTAGLTTLKILKRENGYRKLEEKTSQLCDEMGRIFSENGVAVKINRAGSMFTPFFLSGQPGGIRDYDGAKLSDTALFSRFFGGMLKNGVSLPPSQFEASFVSFAHTDRDFELTAGACRQAAAAIGKND
jgi:glutamate-1-semialdehyde 2,1-aminomutase